MSTYAGQYGPEPVQDLRGNAQPSAVVHVYNVGTTVHTALYRDKLRAVALANPLPAVAVGQLGLAADGNATFYADPGVYRLQILIAGLVVFDDDVVVDKHPTEPGSGGAGLESIQPGHGFLVDTTDAANPVGSVDEMALSFDASQLSSGVLDVARLPASVAFDVDVANEAARALAAEALLVPTASVGAANGVAPLDSGGHVPAAMIPSVAISDFLGTVASQGAMLALVGERGDWCIRSDIPASFILIAEPSSSLPSWKQLPTPVDAVLSVAGRVGVVTLDDLYDAIGLAASAQAFSIQRTNHTGSQGIATIIGLQAALDAKAAQAITIATGAGLTGGGDLSSNRTLSVVFGTSAGTVAQGNDSRFTDARTPLAHHLTHEAGGSDQLTLTQAQITGLVAALALLAPLANANLTGNPTAPTPAPGDADTSVATTAFVAQAIADGVVGLLDYRGSYNASGNVFPSSGGSGPAGAVLKGDFWICSVAGTLGAKAVTAGDLIIALVDTPGQTAGSWDLISHDLGYAPEDSANKSNDATMAADSATLYPTQHAARAYADGKVAQTITNGVTSSAPSQDAVFDALAVKLDLSAVGTAASRDTGTAAGNVPLVSQADLRYERILLVTGLKTAAYSAAVNEFVPLDTTAGTFAVTLPAAPIDGSRVTVKWVVGGAVPTVVTSGSDVFNVAGGATSAPVGVLNQAITFVYKATGAIWYLETSLSLGGLDTRFAPNVPVVTSVVSSATPTYNVGSADHHLSITALATAITSMTSGLSGSPNNFQRLIVRIKDDGTARAITWGASFVSRGATLPGTTVAGKLLTVGFLWNSVAGVYGCVAVAQEV